jgi:DNA polymerase III alpha subunit
MDIKPILKPSRVETIRAKYDKYKAIYHQNSKNEELASYFYESKLLGFCYSQSIFNILRKYHPDLITVNEASTEIEGASHLVFGGEVKEVIYATSRNAKKTKYVKLKIQDNTGSVNAMLFNDKISYSEEVNNCKFEPGQIVVCEGKKFGDSIFCDIIGVQDAKVYLKLSELKNEN